LVTLALPPDYPSGGDALPRTSVRPVRGLTVKQLEQLELALRASARENAGQQMLFSLVSLAKEHVDAALTGADLPYVQSRQLRLFYSQALFFFVVSLMSVRSKSTLR
jgi:hypothetical protein